jgi:hypothetical protein
VPDPGVTKTLCPLGLPGSRRESCSLAVVKGTGSADLGKPTPRGIRVRPFMGRQNGSTRHGVQPQPPLLCPRRAELRQARAYIRSEYPVESCRR